MLGEVYFACNLSCLISVGLAELCVVIATNRRQELSSQQNIDKCMEPVNIFLFVFSLGKRILEQ